MNKNKIIRLSNNRGKELAIISGMSFCKDKADCIVSIDADLQDDINKIGEMVHLYKNGAHIVCGVRGNRDTDNLLKNFPLNFFTK